MEEIKQITLTTNLNHCIAPLCYCVFKDEKSKKICKIVFAAVWRNILFPNTLFASVDIPGLSFTVTESWCLAPPQIRGETRSSRWKIRNLAPANRSPIISIVIYYMSTGRGLNEWPQNIMENMSTRCRLNVSFVSKKSFQNNWSADEKTICFKSLSFNKIVSKCFVFKNMQKVKQNHAKSPSLYPPCEHLFLTCG